MNVLPLLRSPQFYLFAPVAASFAAWMIPGTSEALRGFETRASGGITAWLLIVDLYIVFGVLLWLGTKVGAHLRVPTHLAATSQTPTFDRTFSWTLTIISLIGVGFATVQAAQDHSIVDLLQSGQGNQLKESLSGSAGIETLRYAPAVAAPVALVRKLNHGGSLFQVIVNVILLLWSSAFSSRLTFLAAIVIFLVMLALSRREMRIRVWLLICGGVAIFAALTAFNYFRNYNYYLRVGVSNPLMMNIYQILSYLGAPAQASVGVASAISGRDYTVSTDPYSLIGMVTPSFLSSAPTDATSTPGYLSYVDVASNLTTNSAFANIYSQYGWAGLVVVGLTLFVAGALFGVFRQFDSLLVVGAGVLMYGVSEIWRIYIFGQGIFIFLLLVVIVAGVLSMAIRHDRSRGEVSAYHPRLEKEMPPSGSLR